MTPRVRTHGTQSYGPFETEGHRRFNLFSSVRIYLNSNMYIIERLTIDEAHTPSPIKKENANNSNTATWRMPGSPKDHQNEARSFRARARRAAAPGQLLLLARRRGRGARDVDLEARELNDGDRDVVPVAALLLEGPDLHRLPRHLPRRVLRRPRVARVHAEPVLDHRDHGVVVDELPHTVAREDQELVLVVEGVGGDVGVWDHPVRVQLRVAEGSAHRDARVVALRVHVHAGDGAPLRVADKAAGLVDALFLVLRLVVLRERDAIERGLERYMAIPGETMRLQSHFTAALKSAHVTAPTTRPCRSPDHPGPNHASQIQSTTHVAPRRGALARRAGDDRARVARVREVPAREREGAALQRGQPRAKASGTAVLASHGGPLTATQRPGLDAGEVSSRARNSKYSTLQRER
jgi:hypothetical protein